VLVAAPDIAGGYVAEHLHGIGRLADETGDRALAREYYRRYLGLRTRADPELQAQVADVRERLARLSREGER
jgi:hypothetical protein